MHAAKLMGFHLVDLSVPGDHYFYFFFFKRIPYSFQIFFLKMAVKSQIKKVNNKNFSEFLRNTFFSLIFLDARLKSSSQNNLF